MSIVCQNTRTLYIAPLCLRKDSIPFSDLFDLLKSRGNDTPLTSNHACQSFKCRCLDRSLIKFHGVDIGVYRVVERKRKKVKVSSQ